MNALNWLSGRFSNRGRALSLYKRGITKARKHDHQGAIDDYTMTIDMPDAPANVKAMVLYNRALVLVATGDYSQAAHDFDAVLSMDDAPANVKALARQKIAKRESQCRKSKM